MMLAASAALERLTYFVNAGIAIAAKIPITTIPPRPSTMAVTRQELLLLCLWRSGSVSSSSLFTAFMASQINARNRCFIPDGCVYSSLWLVTGALRVTIGRNRGAPRAPKDCIEHRHHQ